MLRNRIPAKIVSAMLGHSSIGITMDTYSHVMTASILLRIGALDSKNDYTKNHSKVKHKFEKCAIF